MMEAPFDLDDLAVPAAGGQRIQRSSFRGASARSYLLLLLGGHAFHEGGRAWTKTLVGALGLVGFEERAARQALARSAQAGWLATERRGRRVRWRITQQGNALLDEGERRLFAPNPESDWDGEWLMVLTTVSERHRKLRHRLRTQLGWAGFGSLGQGVWISPHPSRAGEARRLLGSLGSAAQGILLHTRLDDPDERHRLAAQAWDTQELAARYKVFIDRFERAGPDGPGDALAAQAHLLYEWRRFVVDDPGLPPALLPPDWPGEQARRLFLDRHTEWSPQARDWWRASEEANERGPLRRPPEASG